MCDQHSQPSNALISAQNHGTILVMVAWSLASLLALCTAARVIARCTSKSLSYLPFSDDAFVVTASLCALGSILVTTTAVDSGLGKKECLLSPGDLEQIQIKVFIATILFVLAISISKLSMILFLHRLADTALQRVGVVTISGLVLLWTIAVISGTVFQCELPRPWEIWTGKCIPLAPFWISTTAVDIATDLFMLILSLQMVWALQTEYRQKTLATLTLSLRLLLIATSVVRIYFLLHAFSVKADPTFDYIPYAVVTEGHAAIAVMIACTYMLSPVETLLQIARSPKPKSRMSKHWSGTTVGSAYNPYDSVWLNQGIVKEPLPSIQASMSTPSSPAASRQHSLSSEILLPEPLVLKRFKKAPPRPPPPSEDQRPDLSMFYHKMKARDPPLVTRLG